jgi:hypothetical protein
MFYRLLDDEVCGNYNNCCLLANTPVCYQTTFIENLLAFENF